MGKGRDYLCSLSKRKSDCVRVSRTRINVGVKLTTLGLSGLPELWTSLWTTRAAVRDPRLSSATSLGLERRTRFANFSASLTHACSCSWDGEGRRGTTSANRSSSTVRLPRTTHSATVT